MLNAENSSLLQFQEYSGYRLPLTVAIVLSGQYEDDQDNCEHVIYTGQGGNDLLGNKRQIGDQVMERGNLGLKVSILFLNLLFMMLFLIVFGV